MCLGLLNSEKYQYLDRHYLPTKVHLVKAMVFPVIMYRCESWTIKKASAEQLMLSNCGAGKTESVRLPRDQTSQS